MKGSLRRAVANYKAATGGVDGFLPRIPLDMSKECWERILTLLQ